MLIIFVYSLKVVSHIFLLELNQIFISRKNQSERRMRGERSGKEGKGERKGRRKQDNVNIYVRCYCSQRIFTTPMRHHFIQFSHRSEGNYCIYLLHEG